MEEVLRNIQEFLRQIWALHRSVSSFMNVPKIMSKLNLYCILLCLAYFNYFSYKNNNLLCLTRTHVQDGPANSVDKPYEL